MLAGLGTKGGGFFGAVEAVEAPMWGGVGALADGSGETTTTVGGELADGGAEGADPVDGTGALGVGSAPTVVVGALE